MPLQLRPTGLGSGIDKDRVDYTIFTGEWEIGRIFETRGQPENLPWFWSLTINYNPTTTNKLIPSSFVNDIPNSFQTKLIRAHFNQLECFSNFRLRWLRLCGRFEQHVEHT